MREALKREKGFLILLLLCLVFGIVTVRHVRDAEKGVQVPIADYKPPVTALIDINSADVLLLTALPGIGEKTAQRIIENRPYTSCEELLELKGIGEKTYDAIADRICVGKPGLPVP